MAEFLHDLNIHGAGQIQFKTTAGANAGKIDQNGNDLVLSNAVGDIIIGNGSDDVYIGDGTNAVDIRFEQNMAIYADSSSTRTLTLGGANTSLILESPTINGSLNIGATTINNKLTFTTASGYILFDYETSDTGEYGTEAALLKIDRGGTEKTILSRVSKEGGIALGADDTVAILAGDVKNVIKTNLNLVNENVIIASESGFHAFGFPNNDTTWSNRQEFRFYTGGTDTSLNGLWIGDGGNTQFIDLDRNLKNIGTISSGAITATDYRSSSHIYLTSGDSWIFRSTGGTEYARFKSNGYLGIGTTNPDEKLHVMYAHADGTATAYAKAVIEDTDAQLDLLSTSDGTWGSAINLVEAAGSGANTNVWSMARKTTGGTGDSSLNFNFGTSNQHNNTTRVSFSSTGNITANQLNLDSIGDYITFYGGGETNHSITSRQLDGGTGDDIRVNTYGSFIVNLDSNNNQNSGANSSFFVGRHGSNASAISGTNLLFQIDGQTGDVLPGTDNTHDLGSSTKRWQNVVAVNLHGDGSNITNVPGPSNMVTTDTSQTISGSKNFTSNGNQFNGHVYFNAYDANGNHYPHFRDGSNSNGANINIRQYYGSANYKTHVMSSDSSGNMQFDFQGTLKGDALTIDGSVDINGNTDISGTLTSGKHVINTASDDILTLNQTSTDNKWNYINFNNQGTREWFIGQDSDGNFDLYNDNINAYAITVNLSNNSILLNDTVTVAQALTVTTGNLTVSSGSISISGDGSNPVTLTESGSGDFTIDAADDIRLDAGGGDIVLRDDGSEYARLTNESQTLVIKASTDDRDIKFDGFDGGTGITALKLDMSAAGEGIFNNNIRVPGEITQAGSTTFSIDLKDHSNYTWLRNEPGQWSFQSGTSGDDWTQSWQIYVPNVGSDGGNATFVELGQRHTNDTTGEFKGVKIVKRTASGVVDGDFQAGATTVSDLTVTGDLNITGDINTQTVNNLDVVDKLITLGKGQTEANSNGSGIFVDGSSASLLWDETNNTWDFNKSLDVVGNIAVSGTVDGVDIAALAAANTGTNTGDQDISGIATNATAISGKVSKSGDTITSGTSIGLTINHDTFEQGLVLHRNHADNAASILFKNNSGEIGTLFAIASDDNPYWRFAGNATNYKIWHAGNDGAGSGLDADTLDGSQKSAFLLKSGGTMTGALNVGVNTSGVDFIAYGNDAGERMFWDASESNLTINHDTDDAGLEIYTVSSAQPTTHQVKIGRDNGQYLGIRVDDGRSYFVHRQDESAGTDNHHQTNQIWTDGGGTHTWNWDIADSSGGSASNKMQLNSSGHLALAGKIVTTEVESSGALLLDAAADITIDAGGQDIILSDDGTIFGTLSNSSGFQIRSRVNNADMFFRGVDDNTEFNALRLDMSAGGNATFAGNINLGRNLVFDDATGGINYITSATELNMGPTSSAHNATGHANVIYGGSPAAGTTNNIAGGNLWLAGGAGKGTGAGGDIIFRVAPAGSSGSSINAYETALTISDDKSATFGGDILVNTATSGGYIQIDHSDDSLKLADANKLKLGTGNDLQIYHDGSNSYIDEVGTGNLYIRSGNFYLQTDTNENAVVGLSSSEVQLFHNGNEKFATKSDGVQVTGNIAVTGTVDGVDISGLPTFSTVGTAFAQLGDVSVASYIRVNADETLAYLNASQFLTAIGGVDGSAYLPLAGGTMTGDVQFNGDNYHLMWDKSANRLEFWDNAKLSFGDPGGTPDLEIYHNGTDSYIDDKGTGDLRIRSNFLKIEKYTGETMATFNDDNAVTLYYNNSGKFATTSTGVSVTGTIADRDIPCLFNSNFQDLSGTTRRFISFNSTTINAASSPSVVNYLVMPYAGKVKKVYFKRVAGSSGTGFNITMYIYKNGANVANSGAIAWPSSHQAAWSPTSSNTFAAGDTIAIAFQKTTSGVTLGHVSVGLAVELTDYDI